MNLAAARLRCISDIVILILFTVRIRNLSVFHFYDKMKVANTILFKLIRFSDDSFTKKKNKYQ